MGFKKSKIHAPSTPSSKTARLPDRERRGRSRAGWIALALGFVAVAGLVLNALPGSDVRTRAERDLAHYGTYRTRLTPDQQAIKKAALGEIPASDLAAARGYGAASIREEVERWLAEINLNGAAGDACAKGRCERPFHEDGCGGMKEGRLS